MKKSIYILFFLLYSACCFGQNAKVDSILALLKINKADTSRLMDLYRLSDEYETTGNYVNGLNYGNQALELANTILNKVGILKKEEFCAQKYKAKTYLNIGIIYFDQSNYPEALKNHLNSLKIMEAMGDKSGQAASYNNIGNVFSAQNNYQEALKNYFKSLQIRETNRIPGEQMYNKPGIAACLSNIGAIYGLQGNYPEALKNHFASLKIREELGDKRSVASSYNNIGLIYYHLGNYTEALKNYSAAFEIKKTMNMSIVGSCNNVGAVYIKLHKYKEAEDYLFKAMKLGKESSSKEYLKEIYSRVSELDSAKSNFKGAYENHKLYILYRDSLDNEETRKKTIQSQMTYDFEKKEAVATAEHKKELENQQILADEKSRKQRVVLLLVSCFLLLVLFFAGFIFRSLRTTRKQKNIIEEQKNLVEKQKQEVEHQKLLVEEHQKEIIDSITYARRIQRSLLPTEKYIERNLKRLKKE